MLAIDDLKDWLHRDLSKNAKALLTLATFDEPCEVKDIKDRARHAGYAPMSWNISSGLKSQTGKAIRTPKGWEITDAGKQHLKSLGVTTISPAAAQVAVDLRRHLGNIADDDTRAFVDEAVQCYELKFYRSAVVMSWLAAVHILKLEVCQSHLSAFNAEAKRINPKWKMAKTPDDLGLMKESDFLDRLVAISMIGKNVKSALKNCLDLRNSCGHPNSYQLGPNKVAAHIEDLLKNVFDNYCC